jgi:small-conductance mechanosensitive channel
VSHYGGGVIGRLDQLLADKGDAQVFVGHAIGIAGTIVVLVVLRWLIHKIIDRLTRSVSDNALAKRLARTRAGGAVLAPVVERSQARAKTAGSLLKSITTFILLVIGVVTILALVGVNVAPIIASAGVLGIALGFGAQSLVKDFITGIFMIMEDQYGVGDVVEVGAVIGTVDQVGLRITRISDGNGVVWYVPNGSITALGNRSQGWGMSIVDVPINYGEDIDRVTEILRSTATALGDDPEWNDLILDEPPVVAVESITPMAVTMRVLLKTLPGENVPVARELRLRAIAALEREGISAPASATTAATQAATQAAAQADAPSGPS